MKTEKAILQELKELDASFLIQQIGMPYTVASTYFAQFPVTLLQFIKAQDIHIMPADKNASKQQTFEVPQGYFEEFAKGILDQVNTVADEHIALQFIPMPYVLGVQDYFECFPETVLALVKEEPVLSVQSKVMPFELEANYFNRFSQEVIENVHELKDAPILASIGRGLPYVLPENYFGDIEIPVQSTNTQASIDNATIEFKPQKRRVFWKNWNMAAGMAILLTAGWMYFSKSSSVSTYNHVNINTLVSNISEEDIDAYISMHLEDFEMTQLMAVVQNDKSAGVQSSNKIQTLINNISKEDIDAYLEVVE